MNTLWGLTFTALLGIGQPTGEEKHFDAPTMKTLTGHSWTWKAIQPRQVVLWHIWSPHCPPAYAAIPNLTKLHKKHHAKGLRVCAVAIKRGASFPPLRPDVLKAQNHFHIPYMLLLSTPEHPIFERFPLKAFPTTYLLDANGRMLASYTGNLSPSAWADLDQHISQNLNKQ